MIRHVIPVLFLALANAAAAQSASEHIALGNQAYDARNAPEALKQYEAALASEPKNYEALWRAARSGVDLGEFDANADQQLAFFKTAEQRGRLAVQVNPNGADGHFALARALGRTALSLGVRDRVRYAVEIRNQALECLKINPQHAGCLHVMGVWNAEVMRLNGFSRMMARNFLGGQVLGSASWDEARRYMEAAVTNEPRRIIHRLDLGRVYADMGLKTRARTQFEAVVNGEVLEYNDPHYKAQAEDALKHL